jgi:hypothetical protein
MVRLFPFPDNKGIVGQLNSFVRALSWRYGGRSLRRRYRRRRPAPRRSVHASVTSFRMSSTLSKPDTTALSAHRRAADQNAILCAAQQKRFGDPPRRARNGRLHHGHPGRVIMRNRSAATEGREAPELC